jgi:uncharacterized protein YcfJ
MKKLQRTCLTILVAVLVLALFDVPQTTVLALNAGTESLEINTAASPEPATTVVRRRNPEAGKKKAAKRAAIGAAIGAGAGALMGGGKGAAIGAAAGAGGGIAYHHYKKHKARKRVY